MKAAVFHRAGKPLTIEDVDDPRPQAGEVIIQVKRCGICGTDLHLTREDDLIPQGMVLGHEFIGEVVEKGQQVGDDWHSGDRLSAMPFISCGRCLSCRLGRPFQCSALQILGWMAPGGFAEYMRVAVNNAVKVPESVSWAEGALIEPLAVGLHSARAAGALDGKNVLVIGAGPIGLASAFWAKFLGARHVIVSELDSNRLGMAQRFCATGVIDPNKEEAGPQFETLCGSAPEVIFECVGIPGMIAQCVALAAHGTTVVVVGYCMQQERFVPADAMAKELTMRFATAYTQQDFQLVTDMIASNRVDARMLHTDTVGFDRFSEVFEGLRSPNQQCKVLLDPQQ